MSNTSEDPDVWIAQLMNCKPLSEGEVKKLCDKVSLRVSSQNVRYSSRLATPKEYAVTVAEGG